MIIEEGWRKVFLFLIGMIGYFFVVAISDAETEILGYYYFSKLGFFGGGRERRAPETLGLRFWIGGSGDTAIDTLVCSVCPLLDRPPCDTQELIISAGLLPKSS